MARFARRLDHCALILAAVPGRFIARRRGCSAAVFYFHDQVPRWDAWVEPGAYNFRLGRLEIQIDRPGLL